MKASQLVEQLQNQMSKYGDLEVAIDVVSESQIFEITDMVEWDTFEPGHPGYYILETKEEIC